MTADCPVYIRDSVISLFSEYMRLSEDSYVSCVFDTNEEPNLSEGKQLFVFTSKPYHWLS